MTHQYRHIKKLFLLVSVLLVCPAMSGQFRTVCFFGKNADLQLYHQAAGELVETELPKRNLSQAYKFSNNAPIVFGLPDEESPGGIKPILEVKVQDGITEALLVFLPAPRDSKIPYQVVVIDGSSDNFKPGSLHFINLSQTQVLGYFGGRRMELAPKKMKRVKAPQGINEDGNYYVSLKTVQGKSTRPLYKGYWPHDSDIRRVVFIFNDKRNNRVRFMGIPYKTSKELKKEAKAVE